MFHRDDVLQKGWSAAAEVMVRSGRGDGPQRQRLWSAEGMVHRRDGPQKGWCTVGMVLGRNVTKILLLNNFLFSIFLKITALLF